MRATPQKDTPAEVEVRRRLHERGLRFRKDFPIKGVTRSRPDIVFTRQKVAVYIDGCFWHRCPTHGTLPRANGKWWAAKLSENRLRDARHGQELEGAGWVVLRFWEHQSADDVASAIDRIVTNKHLEKETPHAGDQEPSDSALQIQAS